MVLPPSELGRGVVIGPGGTVPSGWAGMQRVWVDHDALAEPASTVAMLHRFWSQRVPVVVELGVSTQELKDPESLSLEPYELQPTFEFERERLHFLVWANNYDATRGEPVWWHAKLAQRLGAALHPEAEIDLQGPRWCDGGPRSSVPFPVVHRESIECKSLRLTYPLERPPEGTFDLEQLAVVSSQRGCARILAPAGSGKTRVLTGRFQGLMRSGFEPSRVSALAYNRRAALEMISRLQDGTNSVRTLHSLAFRLLRRFYRHLAVASPSQSRAILRDLVKVAPQVNADPWAPYLEALQTVRLGLVAPAEVEAQREDIPGFATMFPRYRQRLANANLVDHDDQIYGCIELLLRNPEARKLAQSESTHLLVDEFQDLTPAFLLLIRLISAPGYQVFGVGDDDQVIYGYCGATPDYLVKFSDYFPEPETYLLKTNYRCPRGVVDAANHLLARNKVRVSKTAMAGDGATVEGPTLLLAQSEDLASKALQQIELWRKDYECQAIAVLSRVNAALMPLQVALQQAGIPHSKVVDESILQRTGLRTALAYWRLCTEKVWGGDDLRDALRRPNRMLRREVIDTAGRCRNATDLRRYGLKLDPWPASQIDEFLDDLSRLGARVSRGPAAFFQALRRETAFTAALDSLDSAGLGSGGSSHRDDLIALESLAALCDEPDFEGWLRGWLKLETGDEQGVRLSTVHRVKGLEWPCVLVYGTDEGVFPHRLAEDLEEERRIFHVAITRSQKHCVLLGTAKTLSPFIAEMVAPAEPKKKPKKKKKR